MFYIKILENSTDKILKWNWKRKVLVSHWHLVVSPTFAYVFVSPGSPTFANHIDIIIFILFKGSNQSHIKRNADETARGRNGKGTKRPGDETTWDETARGRNDQIPYRVLERCSVVVVHLWRWFSLEVRWMYSHQCLTRAYLRCLQTNYNFKVHQTKPPRHNIIILPQ